MASSHVADPIRFPVLIGDIGGTNARFAMLADPEAAPETFRPAATADFPDIQAAVEAVVLAQTAVRPRSAMIAMAGPISGDAVPLTNALWTLRPPEMIAGLKLDDVVLLNDFEALALALTALAGSDLELVGGPADGGSGAKVVLGPGTGLGAGALVEAGGKFVPVPGEGGHVALGPAEADEFPIWANLEPEHGRISAEAILCGRGLVRLYRAVAQTEAATPRFTRPDEITGAALAASDEIAVRTVSLFVRLLGRVAGDMALIFMARGGAYLGGGISSRIVPFLQGGEFRRAFEAKAPHEELMQAIPSWVIVRDNAALPGLAALARAPDRFEVTLTGRRWRRA